MSFLSWHRMHRFLFLLTIFNRSILLSSFVLHKKWKTQFFIFFQAWQNELPFSLVSGSFYTTSRGNEWTSDEFIFLHMFKSVKYLGIQFNKKVISNHFLQQLCTSLSRYCQEAVDSLTVVDSCPTSKTEWDVAARKKNCGRMASQQYCTTVEKYQYHCVVNGLRSELLEVCAPTRIIFGTVFNTIIS